MHATAILYLTDPMSQADSGTRKNRLVRHIPPGNRAPSWADSETHCVYNAGHHKTQHRCGAESGSLCELLFQAELKWWALVDSNH